MGRTLATGIEAALCSLEDRKNPKPLVAIRPRGETIDAAINEMLTLVPQRLRFWHLDGFRGVFLAAGI